MIDRPRNPGELDISESLRAVLVELRQRSSVDAPAELDVERVREIEAAVGMHLGDDLLAVFAAQIPRLTERFRITLSMVIGHTGAVQSHGARGDLIGVGQAAADVFYCIDKGATTTRETQLLRYDVSEKSTESYPLVDWLKDQLAVVRRTTTLAPAFMGSPPELRPRLTRAVPESTAVGRRVSHKKFGEGKALREIGSGPTRKVQVDFPGLGLKLLQARFLEFLD